MTQETALPVEGRTSFARQKITSATWCLFWLLGSGWICYSLAVAWPHVHLPPQLMLLFTLPGLLFRSVDLAWMHSTGRSLSRGWRWIARLLAIPGGLLLSALVWTPLDEISMARFERALAPLIHQIEANGAAPCQPAARYVIGTELADYLVDSNAPGSPLRLSTLGRRFVLVADGRSIDIDGSTIFYDSSVGAWRKFHNDSSDSVQALNALIKDMKQCRIPLH